MFLLQCATSSINFVTGPDPTTSVSRISKSTLDFSDNMCEVSKVTTVIHSEILSACEMACIHSFDAVTVRVHESYICTENVLKNRNRSFKQLRVDCTSLCINKSVQYGRILGNKTFHSMRATGATCTSVVSLNIFRRGWDTIHLKHYDHL